MKCYEGVWRKQFNQEEGNELDVVYGAVTTGEIWRFLKLSDGKLQVDLSNFYIKEVDKVLGILLAGVTTSEQV